jgi:hypothetical protein
MGRRSEGRNFFAAVFQAWRELSVPAMLCFKATTEGWRFPAQDLGGRRQFHLLWWQALGGISAEEHTNIFVHEPGGVIGSHDPRVFDQKPQRIVGGFSSCFSVK